MKEIKVTNGHSNAIHSFISFHHYLCCVCAVIFINRDRVPLCSTKVNSRCSSREFKVNWRHSPPVNYISILSHFLSLKRCLGEGTLLPPNNGYHHLVVSKVKHRPHRIVFGWCTNVVSDRRPMWSRIRDRCGLGSETDVVSDQRPVWSRIGDRCGLGSETDVVSDQRPMWSRIRDRCGLGSETDVVSDQRPMWSRIRDRCGLRISGLGSERETDVVDVLRDRCGRWWGSNVVVDGVAMWSSMGNQCGRRWETNAVVDGKPMRSYRFYKSWSWYDRW